MNEINTDEARHSQAALLVALPTFQTMDEAIEAAAKYLPSGWEIFLSVEKDGYGTYLSDPEGMEISIDGGDGMRSDFYDGIMRANGVDC